MLQQKHVVVLISQEPIYKGSAWTPRVICSERSRLILFLLSYKEREHHSLENNRRMPYPLAIGPGVKLALPCTEPLHQFDAKYTRPELAQLYT